MELLSSQEYSTKSGLISKRLVAAKTSGAAFYAKHPKTGIDGRRSWIENDRIKSISKRLVQAIFWSDSMNVLWWVRGRSGSFKPFVAICVGEIQNLTNPNQRRFAPTKENPADFVTRGLQISELAYKYQNWLRAKSGGMVQIS